jgi:hypothetical protein
MNGYVFCSRTKPGRQHFEKKDGALLCGAKRFDGTRTTRNTSKLTCEKCKRALATWERNQGTLRFHEGAADT